MSIAAAFVLCNLLTAVLGILTIIFSLRLRQLQSVRWLLLLTVCFLVSSLFTANVYIVQNFEEKVLFFQLRVLAMIFVPPCWLYFISSVCNRWNWLHKKWVMIFVLAPSAVNFSLMLFPASRELLFYGYKSFSYHDVSAVGFKLGAWYGPFYAWSMLLMFLSYVISIISFVRESGFRRRQILILNMGLGAALISYFFARAELLEWIMADCVSILCTQTGIMYAAIRHRLLNVVPLAMVRIFQQLPDPVFVIDDQKRVMGANDKATLFFDLPRNFLGQSIEKLLPSLSLTSGEVLLLGKNQRSHYFHLALEKIGDENGSSPGTVVFFRDIGVQKNVEQRLNEGLEFRASLLAFLAHDLMGFVESQALMSQALQKNALPEHRQQLELLTSSALASQELVHNMMSWVKSQSLQMQPLKRSFEWNLLLKETLEQMQSRLALKGVNVEFSSAKKPFFAEGDSEILAAAFRNILSNSVRATPQGKKIYISLEARTGSAEVKIRDEGCGIETAELERIREASQKFLLTGVSKTHGSGIGLMVARHFVSLHQGRFEMSSRLGVGTEVFISIPS